MKLPLLAKVNIVLETLVLGVTYDENYDFQSERCNAAFTFQFTTLKEEHNYGSKCKQRIL